MWYLNWCILCRFRSYNVTARPESSEFSDKRHRRRRRPTHWCQNAAPNIRLVRNSSSAFLGGCKLGMCQLASSTTGGLSLESNLLSSVGETSNGVLGDDDDDMARSDADAIRGIFFEQSAVGARERSIARGSGESEKAKAVEGQSPPPLNPNFTTILQFEATFHALDISQETYCPTHQRIV